MSLNALTRVLTACSALVVLGYGSTAHAGNGPTTMTRALAGAHGNETVAATRITRSLPSEPQSAPNMRTSETGSGAGTRIAETEGAERLLRSLLGSMSIEGTGATRMERSLPGASSGEQTSSRALPSERAKREPRIVGHPMRQPLLDAMPVSDARRGS